MSEPARETSPSQPPAGPPVRRRLLPWVLGIALVIALIPVAPTLWQWIALEDHTEWVAYSTGGSTLLRRGEPALGSFEENYSVWSFGPQSGKRHGQFISYWAGGEPRERGAYRNDQRVGIWTVWGEDGAVENQQRYDSHGQLVDGRDQEPWFEGGAEPPPLRRAKN
jgi:hypothetical protein